MDQALGRQRAAAHRSPDIPGRVRSSATHRNIYKLPAMCQRPGSSGYNKLCADKDTIYRPAEDMCRCESDVFNFRFT
ncbi:hypothetical protein NDU88_007294 [Pleurodeles waltl]|uniref:Uncharacterized protein n=1 Tax=Pleurodeles waltl TaxID=8319 RepID=A0AAV7WGY3_PLEWA|nr:hypothetical protein NDU88_007294 [Pleurodeles waltl]